MSTRKPAPDQGDRERAINARDENVIADAGAGTGKTTLLVARVVGLVAPEDDGPALALGRVAAITFTRKAAGELRLRIREAFLRELARRDLTALRRERLAAALGALDTAHVGTIHSFADRLLRLRPVEARLSPAYDIVEDDAALVTEAYEAFLHAVEAGTLADELEGRVDRKVADAAQAAFLDALRARLRAERRVHDHGEDPGLDSLVEALIQTRDVRPVAPLAKKPDLRKFRDLVDEYVGYAKKSKGDGQGSRWVAATRRRLARVRDEEDPVLVLKELLRSSPYRTLAMRADFPDDPAGWALYKAWLGDDGQKALREGSLREDLLRPFSRWLSRRLVAAAPAVVAMYERVKARHRAVDQLDLLLELRNLLRRDRAVRAEYQALFDHVLVDEFQDTDPLQAEIVLYLCERGAVADDWSGVALVPGKLTIVGDPKQSIYRFRRADIGVYATVRAIVEKGPHVVAKLRANFRCEPALVEWLNARFDDLLGAAAGGLVFDAEAGTVANEPLLAGREGGAPTAVQLLPLAAEGTRKPVFRQTEAKALAAWLRWLVEGKKRTIVDPATGARRAAGYGDVAVLVVSTYNLPLLFAELDRLGVPYAPRGGSVFLGDALHRQFLLALRAIADRDDGVAQAALLRPPFFAVDHEDLARTHAADDATTHPGVLRARAALDVVRDLRRTRLDRSPGATARDLLERTAFGRAAALGPNGAQRLDALRELCLALDAVAAEGLDFDAATARLRAWVDDPVQLDPPRPVAGDAVQILSIHQAKGLEFPVVVLWDGCAELAARDVRSPFVVDRTGTSWALSLDGVEWDEPADGDVAGREKRYLDAEKRRLVYVAATRARDLLVLPVAGDPDPDWITGRLVAGAPEALMERLEPYALGKEPAWATEVPPPAPRSTGDATALAEATREAWQAAMTDAARPRFAPGSVTGEAHARVEAEERPGEAGAPRPERKSRFGRVFGDTVHLAIRLALRDAALSPGAAVARAAAATGLAERRTEAAKDVARALTALVSAGMRRAPGSDLQLEYPVALAAGGKLVQGYVDLLGVRDGRLAVIDFKTDAPPAGDVRATHAAYVEQVRGYARMLVSLGLAAEGTVDAGLLFTAEGEVRWVSS
jgi:ATP-dependent helicase/nuclease subunit A